MNWSRQCGYCLQIILYMQSGQKSVNVLGDDRIILTGDIIVSGGVNTSLNTNMTIMEVTTELEEAVIFCGTADSPFLGNFTLIAKIHEKAKQSKSVLYRPQKQQWL